MSGAYEDESDRPSGDLASATLGMALGLIIGTAFGPFHETLFAALGAFTLFVSMYLESRRWIHD